MYVYYVVFYNIHTMLIYTPCPYTQFLYTTRYIQAFFPCFSGFIMYKLCGLNPAPGRLWRFLGILTVVSWDMYMNGLCVRVYICLSIHFRWRMSYMCMKCVLIYMIHIYTRFMYVGVYGQHCPWYERRLSGRVCRVCGGDRSCSDGGLHRVRRPVCRQHALVLKVRA